MQDVEGFDKADYPLHQAAVAEWEGFLFVNVAEAPEPFEQAWAPLRGRFARFGIPKLVVEHHVVYDVRANWKLVFQNYSECLHCPTIHPKLASVLPYQSGANDSPRGRFSVATWRSRRPTRRHDDGPRGEPPGERRHPGSRPPARVLLLADAQHAVEHALRLRELLHPRPVAVDRTEVESEWLFHPDTLADSNNNIRDAIEFWDLTNRQDWDIVGQSQLGISSRRYAPGPYSARESVPAAWDREEYVRWMGRG